MIEAMGLGLRLGGAEVLKGVSARFETGGFYGMVGPNGSGKTSLLKAMAGLIAPHAGEVRCGDQALGRLSVSQRATLIGYLPQERAIAWDMTVREIVRLGAQRFADREARAGEAMTRVGLIDLADRGVFSLSGGQRARVLLARLLATDCPVLLLDEPLTALDPAWQRRMLQVLRDYAGMGRTVIASLHDLGLAAQMCDRLCVMHHGVCVALDDSEKALNTNNLSDVFHLTGEWTGPLESRVLSLSPQPLLAY